MELVIKIPEEIYKASKIINVQYEDVIQIPLEVIANGIPIPRNHGDLKDISRLESHDEYDGQGFTKSVYQDDIDNLPPIIKADKESEVRNEMS